ncbi:MAG TPA: carboxypeptidase-like regulatory domain-containing protein, partial [Gemmatimonadaceae bacterium]|nr:carboxypeptidase-like regulatory domain-containing protein [Gemmatimonadaceae bacterium]
MIRTLAHKAHLRPVYDEGDPALAERVTVHIVDVGILEALAIVLKGTRLVGMLAPDGETIMIHAPPGRGLADRITGGAIYGRVSDSASGQGLGGATVRVVGTKISVVTSDSGRFTLKEVPTGDQVLSAKLFGYRPAEQTVTVADSSHTTVRIVLVPIPTVLSGVVTTATGQQQRYQVGNDITVLNADSVMKVAPVSNLTDLLETRVPGLIVQHTSGIPGAPSRLRLRGISSINSSSDPILIIDGVRVYADQSGNTNPQQQGSITSGGGSQVSTIPTDNSNTINHLTFSGPSALDQLDPNSIESIEVLKG